MDNGVMGLSSNTYLQDSPCNQGIDKLSDDWFDDFQHFMNPKERQQMEATFNACSNGYRVSNNDCQLPQNTLPALNIASSVNGSDFDAALGALPHFTLNDVPFDPSCFSLVDEAIMEFANGEMVDCDETASNLFNLPASASDVTCIFDQKPSHASLPATPASLQAIPMSANFVPVNLNTTIGNMPTAKLSSTPASPVSPLMKSMPPCSPAPACTPSQRHATNATAMSPIGPGCNALPTPEATPTKPRKAGTTSIHRVNSGMVKKAPAKQPRAPRKTRSPPKSKASPEARIPPEEILGMSWDDVERLQDNNQSTQLTIFTSLEEAHWAEYDLQAPIDDTFPTELADKQILITLMIAAMKDVTIAADGATVMKPWVESYHEDAQIEHACWKLLESLISSQRSSNQVTGTPKKRLYDTFGERFMGALAALKKSKLVCKSLLLPESSVTIAEDPVDAVKVKNTNSTINNKKAVQIATGKYVLENLEGLGLSAEALQEVMVKAGEKKR